MPVFIDKSGSTTPETSAPVVYSGTFTAEWSDWTTGAKYFVEVAL